MKLGIFSFNTALLLLLSVRLAEAGGSEVAREFVATANEVILYPLIILMMAVAVLVFLYGGFEYIFYSDTDSAHEIGRRHMLWGIIGLLVMVSAMAILEIAANTFDLGGELDDARPR